MEKKKKILIVEDSKTQALKLEYLLYISGYLPLIAEDGFSALHLAKQELPDLIISDIVMPKMDGYQFCKQLLNHVSTADTPVILLTALSDTKDILKGLECGASNFIPKPYEDDQLIDKIKKTLKNHELAKDAQPSAAIPIIYEGKEYQINSSRHQIIDILLTTYQTAITKQNALKKAESNLKKLNLSLEERVKEKTDHLTQQIKERQKAEAELYRLSNIVHQAKSTIVLTDLEGNIEYVNPQFTEITGYSLSEVIGKNPRILKSGEQPDEFYRQIWENVLAGKEWKGEFCNKKKNGEVFYESASIFDIRDEDGTVRNLAKIAKDITAQKEAQTRFQRLYNSLLDDIELASSVQSYLLPEWLVHEQNISVTSVYTPSEKVGGDIFDIIPISDSQYVVYVGDISGHGVQAALIMTAVKSTINMLVNMEKADIKPYYIINKLNEILSKDFFQSNYLTIIFCLVDVKENSIRYINAGHPALIEYNKSTNETLIFDDKSAIPVGWMGNYQYLEDDECIIDLNENSLYFLYTDGLFECLNSEGLELGVNGFTDFLADFKDSMDSIILPFILKQKLIDEEYDLKGDDFTLLTLRKFVPDDNKNNLLLRYTAKSAKTVSEAIQEFLSSLYHNDNFYQIVNSIIANHINSINEIYKNAKLKNPILIQISKLNDYLQLTFWEKNRINLYRFNEFNEKDDFYSGSIQDYKFNKYLITMNRYDEIVQSVINIPNPSETLSYPKTPR